MKAHLILILCLFNVVYSQGQSNKNSGSWQVVYSHDKQGNPTGGEIQALIEYIKAGASIKIVAYVGISKEDYDYILSEYANRVWVDDNAVFASTLQYHYNYNKDENNPSWDVSTTPFASIWGTDGKERVTAPNGNKYKHKWDMDWCVQIAQ